jgi:hypothetical protein
MTLCGRFWNKGDVFAARVSVSFRRQSGRLLIPIWQPHLPNDRIEPGISAERWQI